MVGKFTGCTQATRSVCSAKVEPPICCRFFSNSTQPTEFAVDDSAMTVWQSRSGETPVALVVGLTTPTLLSKIFVTFQTSQSYQTAVLQFAQSADAEWQDLQYYAVDCMTSFGVSTNAT